MKQKYSALLNILAEDIKGLYESKTAKDVKKEKIVMRVELGGSTNGEKNCSKYVQSIYQFQKMRCNQWEEAKVK